MLQTCGESKVTQNLGETRKRKFVDEYLKTALDEGAQLAHYHNTTRSSQNIIHRTVKNDLATFQNESSSTKARIPLIRQLVIVHALENRDEETDQRRRLPSLKNRLTM